MKIIQDKIKKTVLTKYGYEELPSYIEVTIPKNNSYGDYTTNIAFKLSKGLHKLPIEIANEITKLLKTDNIFEDVVVSSPGFINFFISAHALYEELNQKNLTQIPLKFIDEEKIKHCLKSFPKEKIDSMQYVHSRIYSIIKIFKQEGINMDEKINLGEYEFSSLQKQILKKIFLYEEMIDKDTETIFLYGIDLSELFYKIEEKILFRKLEKNAQYVMLNIIEYVRKIIQKILQVFLLDAPEKM
ncbi:DALR anticodon-binding domain-containing protein [Anaerophilus nitritogenes]|uniref:DALR anticodon-binding domain-containing protein n=1 Tax=Anaerophilus nitritogenes TaxID=2498136 RepID=UPI0013ED9394|nr:DALR anticodon-binding domain-containing protein [Anaerophilus nitritogenes]